MADPRLPTEIDAYMQSLQWGEHHDQWHYEQRYDFWRHLAANGNQAAAEIVAYGDSMGWSRGEYQEGAPGHGLHFLAMHRAMFQLLLENFPQHQELFQGWTTPPRDPHDADDPVASGDAFSAEKAEGIRMIESDHQWFGSEDEFALFLETNIRPTAEDPTVRTPDLRTAVHNYLHNRWTDGSSPVNLGDPIVNIYNARFWRLHGWIERVWTDYRRAVGLSDDDPDYRELVSHYRHMMEHGLHHHRIGPQPTRPNGLKRIFAD
ncbi:hypothetical protein [Brevundimonas sp.]|jgi:hypothetical protein|uniref:hypothetical protein n=1 Tax=Brevundimonas sp. TaxID=1871086 RepID=UPI002E0D7E06|nr:hypothetical protein [Brevundimonas sp.]